MPSAAWAQSRLGVGSGLRALKVCLARYISIQCRSCARACVLRAPPRAAVHACSHGHMPLCPQLDSLAQMLGPSALLTSRGLPAHVACARHRGSSGRSRPRTCPSGPRMPAPRAPALQRAAWRAVRAATLPVALEAGPLVGRPPLPGDVPSEHAPAPARPYQSYPDGQLTLIHSGILA